MNVKERILTIRLMEKAEMYPGYAKKLGIEVSIHMPSSNHPADSKSNENMP